MHRALKARPVKGCTAAVCEVEQNDQEIKVNHISNFSTFHNFSYEEAGLRITVLGCPVSICETAREDKPECQSRCYESALFECNEAG